MRRILRRVIIEALIVALGFFVVLHVATYKPGFYATGFPLDYSYYDCRVCGCYRFQTGSACRAYNPILMILDYAFLFIIALGAITIADRIHQRISRSISSNHFTFEI